MTSRLRLGINGSKNEFFGSLHSIAPITGTALLISGPTTLTGDVFINGDVVLEGDIDINGDVDMLTNSIINLAEPIDPQDAATMNYVDTTVSGATAASLAGSNTWTGPNVFTGGLSAGSLVVTDIATPVAATDAANMSYVDTEIAAETASLLAANNTWTGTNSFTAGLAAGGLVLSDVATPVAATDAANMDYVDTEVSGASAALLAGTNTWTGSNNFTAGLAAGGLVLSDVATPVAATDAANMDYVDTEIAAETASLLAGTNTWTGANTWSLPLSLSAGTAALPALYMGTDSTSGLYRPAANQLGLSTGGVVRQTLSTSAIGMTLPLNMNSNLISGVTNPVSAQDAATMDYVDTSIAASDTALLAAANTWTGANSFTAGLAAGGLVLTNVATPVAATDAANMGYVDTEVAGATAALLASANTWTGANVFSAGLDAGSLVLTNVATPVAATDAANMDYVDTEVSDATAALLAGTNTWTGANTWSLPLSIQAGSAALPALYMGTDTTSGLFRPALNQLGFSTAGVSRMTISATGTVDATTLNLGMGTVALPALTFGGDVNTGVYLSAADNLGFSTGGVFRMGVYSEGTVHVPGQTRSAYFRGIAPYSPTTPTFTFHDDDDTGMYRGGTGRIRFSNNGSLGFDINETTVDSYRPLAMGSNKITGLGTPTAAADAATMLYVDTSVSNASAALLAGTNTWTGTNTWSLPLSLQAGTAALPALYMGTDTTSGLFRPALNQLGLSTGGVVRQTLTTTGIDMALPLNMNSNLISGVTNPVSAQDAATMSYVGSSITAERAALLAATNTWSAVNTWSTFMNFANGSAASPSLRFTSDTGVGFYRHAANSIGISTAGVQRWVIGATGTVTVSNQTNQNGPLVVNNTTTCNGTLSMASNRILSVATPTTGTDAANMDYVDTSITDANTALLAATNTWTGANTYSQPVSLQAGTAAAPALAFTSDTDTGIWSSVADQLNFSTGGTSRMSINNTQTSVAKLVSTGDASIAGTLIVATSADLPNTTVNGTLSVGGIISAVGKIDIPVATAAAPGLYFAGDTDTGIWSPAADQIGFASQGVNRVTVDKGDFIVHEQLVVEGDAQFNGQVDVGSAIITNVQDPTAAQDAATKNYVDIRFVPVEQKLLPADKNYNGVTPVRITDFTVGATGSSYEIEVWFWIVTTATNPTFAYITSSAAGLTDPPTLPLAVADTIAVAPHMFDTNSTGRQLAHMRAFGVAGNVTHTIWISQTAGTSVALCYMSNQYPAVVVDANPIHIVSRWQSTP